MKSILIKPEFFKFTSNLNHLTQRYFIQLSYQGTNYHGWQIQPNAKTVQEIIESSISKIFGEEISLVGAGRTDTGVHAQIFYAHFDYDKELEINIKKILFLRMRYDVLANGELIHFPPEDGLYVYFKKQGDEVLMCIANESESFKELDISKFSDYLGNKKYFRDLVTEKYYRASAKKLKISPLTVHILQSLKSVE